MTFRTKGNWKPFVIFVWLSMIFFFLSAYSYLQGTTDLGYAFLGLAITSILATGFSGISAATANVFVGEMEPGAVRMRTS